MTGLWVAVAVLAVLWVWLYVNTREEAGQLARLAERVSVAEQKVAILTKRTVMGDDE